MPSSDMNAGHRAGQAPGAPVLSDTGWVAGTGGTIRSFKGIPYAKPPLGELRWRPPQTPDAWTGVRDCTRFGPDPMQPPEYPELRGDGMSEDCLSLNVWTPACDAGARLPVVVWIYGGAYVYGSGSHPSYDGEALARRGIVVVTINYRLGLFGFMAHPQLSAETPTGTSGNYALMDQIAALTWVQRNIAAFGGDPGRVTVVGQSAGALSISCMMISRQARGLFQQAIMQSVGVMRPMCTLAQAEAFGTTVGADIGQLRRMDAAALVHRLGQVQPAMREVTAPRTLGIIVDGDVLDDADWRLYRRGDHLRIPIIVGSNADEGSRMAQDIPVANREAFDLFLASSFRGDEAAARAVYPVTVDADARPVLHRLVADVQYLSGTREMLRLVAPRDPRVYRYVFEQHRNGSDTAPCHGDELQYVFDNLAAPHRGRRRPFDESDSRLARTMADAWARFAATGNPNGPGLPPWPAYDAVRERCLVLTDAPQVREMGMQPALDMIRDFYARERVS